MYNPSYLIKSRHDIYYFRYPLPVTQCGRAGRVSISLKTRCPREALKLANALEYHGIGLIEKLDYQTMDYKELVSVFKDHFAKLLKVKQMTMDEFGPLSKSEVTQMKRSIKLMDSMIEGEFDCIETLEGTKKPQEELDMHKSIMNISKLYELDIEPDSDEYELAKKQYKYVFKNLYKDILTYNEQLTNYSMLSASPDSSQSAVGQYKPERKLAKIIDDYLDEMQSTLGKRALNEQRDCLKYLTDLLGNDYLISKMDNPQVQEIKKLLTETPKNRNKAKATAGLSLLEQVALAKESELPVLGITSVNKYLAYFSALFNWACSNNYREDNPFKGIRIKARKKKHSRRKNFDKAEVEKIINNLGNGEKNEFVKHNTYYWGTLIAVYTGARRNEIASLLPDDIKQDEASGIWYFDITDEEESKQLKTEAAKRIVPIHSKLIELGFLEYVEEARKAIANRPTVKGHPTRLLYKLTYTDHEKWGRSLGRWFNEKYLVALGLKTEKKTLHSLRHSFITNLSAARVEFAHIKAIVGHEAGTVTEQSYGHFEIEHLPVFREAIERLEY